MSSVINAIHCTGIAPPALGYTYRGYGFDISRPAHHVHHQLVRLLIRLKSQLNRAGIGFQEIDIDDDAEGAAIVAQVNDGNLTVPTVLFRDGSVLTNPSVAQVGNRLGSVN